MAEWEHDIPQWWDHTERELYDDVLGGEREVEEDAILQMLFHEAMFDRELDHTSRAEVYERMLDYLWNEYGIDFELDFDWLAYREWYDNAA